MILLLTKEDEIIANILKRKFRRYYIIETGLDKEMLELLIDIYLRSEFNNNKREQAIR